MYIVLKILNMKFELIYRCCLQLPLRGQNFEKKLNVNKIDQFYIAKNIVSGRKFPGAYSEYIAKNIMFKYRRKTKTL